MALTVPIWAVWTIITFMFGGMVSFGSAAVWGINKLNDIKWQFNVINNKLDAASSDRWRKSFQREYNSQLHWSNETLKLPDVDEIARRMQDQ